MSLHTQICYSNSNKRKVNHHYCCRCISGLWVCQLSQVGVKEVPQETLHRRLGRGAQGRIHGKVQHLRGVQGCRACLGGVEAFDGAGQPDQSLQALDVAAAVVHQLVLGHRSAAAGREEREASWYLHQTSVDLSLQTAMCMTGWTGWNKNPRPCDPLCLGVPALVGPEVETFRFRMCCVHVYMFRLTLKPTMWPLSLK